MSKSLDVALENLSKFPEKVVRGTLLDMTSKIIKRSPVDTGRFRGNWQASFGSPKQNITSTSDRTGARATAQAGAVINSMEMGQTFYLANNLPYATRLEFGYSEQAPQGMVRVTVAEFQEAVNKAAR